MKREGAVLYPAENRVRLRHEKPGYLYELRATEDGAYFEVLRVDTVIGSFSPVGRIRREGDKLKPEKTGSPAEDDALLMIARAWSRLPFLKPNT